MPDPADALRRQVRLHRLDGGTRRDDQRCLILTDSSGINLANWQTLCNLFLDVPTKRSQTHILYSKDYLLHHVASRTTHDIFSYATATPEG